MQPNTERKRLVLMRGLPSCGKSWTAKRIAEDEQGVVLEFDSFFEVQSEDGSGGVRFVWDREKLNEAGQAHMREVRGAIDAGVSPIVVDDDHRPGSSNKALVAYALMNRYAVEFAEPDSDWWKTIKALLEDKHANAEALGRWAQKLCLLNRETHGVELRTFVSRMERWIPDLSPLDLLAWGENPTAGDKSSQEVAA